MFVVIVVGIMAVLFAYIAQLKRLRFCLKISFLIIFLFLALRYNYGSDYPVYFDIFFNINEFSLADIKDIWLKTFEFSIVGADNPELELGVGYPSNIELGWQALCLLFRPLGFFAMIAALALFNCMVYYYFIKKYVPPAYYWFAIFLYVFTPELMLYHLSGMRQSVAISIFLLSINYIYSKDFPRYALLIFLATLFHTSAVILFPIYLIGVLNFKTNIPIAIGIFAIFLLLFLLQGPISQVMDAFISTYAVRYSIYTNPGEMDTGIQIILYAIIMILLLLSDRYQREEMSLLYKIAYLSIFTVPFALILQMIARIGMYFQPVLFLASYPFILLKMDKFFPKYSLLARYTFIVIIAFWTIYVFYNFISPSEGWTTSFRSYDTIFSSPLMYQRE